MLQSIWLAGMLLGLAAMGEGAALAPVSYSMPNGSSDFYWDRGYTSCVNCSSLAGGLGSLTDGVTTPSYFSVENGDYTKMVGWQIDPTIRFFFDGPQSFGGIDLHLSDGHGAAGIALPATIVVSDGVETRTLTPVDVTPEGTLNQWYAFDITGLSGDHLDVTLNRSQQFVFADEISFSESAAPEPSTLALCFALAPLAWLLYSRRDAPPRLAAVAGVRRTRRRQ